MLGRFAEPKRKQVQLMLTVLSICVNRTQSEGVTDEPATAANMRRKTIVSVKQWQTTCSE